MEELDDDRTFVIETAIKNNLGSKDEIELYEELLLALELMENQKFEVLFSSIAKGEGIRFQIIAPYELGLPEEVGMLFFNINSKFRVTCMEIEYCFKDEKYCVDKIFEIKIKKNDLFCNQLK